MAKKRPVKSSDILAYVDGQEAQRKVDESDGESDGDKPDLALPFECPDLTGKQRKILGVEFLPDSLLMSVADKARLAGVNVRYWRRFTATDKFKDYAKRLAQIVYGKYTLKLIHAEIKDAIYGGPYGFGDGKVRAKILEKIGIYAPESLPSDGGSTHNGDVYNITQIYNGLSDDESERTDSAAGSVLVGSPRNRL